MNLEDLAMTAYQIYESTILAEEVTEEKITEKWVRLEDAQRVIEEYEEKLKRIRDLLQEFDQKLARKAKTGPPSDYTDLWITCKDMVFYLKEEVQHMWSGWDLSDGMWIRRCLRCGRFQLKTSR